MKAWYLVYCKPKSEIRAQQNLQMQSIETYLPMYLEAKKQRSGKKTVSSVPLFPNYLFIYFDPKVTSVSRIHSTRGVSQIVGCKELMTAIDPALITAIKIQVAKMMNHPIETEEPLPKKGDKIKVNHGAFSEIEGVFDEKSGEKRCFVLLKLLGSMKRVEVPLEAIDKLSA
ncbi:transcription/translation regulatory transformer protein RfaH [Parashewanella tropica]|uniref:transcription/translation regulatory transformer protein RfaH n=1 Tax=Parashewanella tropica TaxID=2547970 RepID=UPI001059701A|nr:transcription/translation regulatory transformer protein RfaH [Parashewanella tropica]